VRSYCADFGGDDRRKKFPALALAGKRTLVPAINRLWRLRRHDVSLRSVPLWKFFEGIDLLASKLRNRKLFTWPKSVHVSMSQRSSGAAAEKHIRTIVPHESSVFSLRAFRITRLSQGNNPETSKTGFSIAKRIPIGGRTNCFEFAAQLSLREDECLRGFVAG